jgi:hypothetical protein
LIIDKKIILGLLIFSNLVFGNEISQSSVATAESQSKACSQALLQAQKKALEQSGINIFSTFESKTIMSDNEVKKVVKNNLQSSYGYIKTISQNKKAKYNPNTGYITCKVNASFEVDTSKLKSQLLALRQKYDNEYEIETTKTRALKQKRALMKKYYALKDNITKKHTFNYDDSYNCGESLGLSDCKNKLKNKIKIFTKKELASKYDISSSLIKMDDIKLYNDIKSTTDDGLIVRYHGKVDAKASSVKNPYIDEINSLNTFLGEKQIINEVKQPKVASTNKKSSNSNNSIIEFFSSRKQYLILNDYINTEDDYSTSSFNWTESSDSSVSDNVEYLIFLKSKYYLKLGFGKASYKDSKKNYSGYGETATGYDKEYNYKFYSLGLSMLSNRKKNQFSQYSVDVDYMIPYSVTGYDKTYLYTKTYEEIPSPWWQRTEYNEYYAETLISDKNAKVEPFTNITLNWDLMISDDILLGMGFILYTDGQAEWEDNFMTFRLGIVL